MESRRTFAKRAGAVALGLVPCALAAGCARFNVMPVAFDGRRLTVSRADLGRSNFALVEVPGLVFPIYVYRHEGDRFTAVLTRCMHRGCQVDAVEGHLICPCHGSEYDNDGAILKGPTLAPLIRYPVTGDAEHLYIDLARAGAGAA